jgi:hypothetical protein
LKIFFFENLAFFEAAYGQSWPIFLTWQPWYAFVFCVWFALQQELLTRGRGSTTSESQNSRTVTLCVRLHNFDRDFFVIQFSFPVIRSWYLFVCYPTTNFILFFIMKRWYRMAWIEIKRLSKSSFVKPRYPKGKKKDSHKNPLFVFQWVRTAM